MEKNKIDRLAFFKFYYYMFTNRRKMMDLVLDTNEKYAAILNTPLAIWVGLTILSAILDTGFTLWVFIILGLAAVGSFIIVSSTFKLCLDIRTKEEIARIQREAKEREEEQRRQFQEQLNRMNDDLNRRKREYEAKQKQQQRTQYTYRGRPIQDDPFVYEPKYHPPAFPQHILDCFTLMGVKPTRDLHELKKVYRQKAKECHPDTPNGSAEKFKNLTKYYDAIRIYIEAS